MPIIFKRLYNYFLLDSSWCKNPNPCLNGNCTDVGDNYTCSCEQGFTGERCEIGEKWFSSSYSRLKELLDCHAQSSLRLYPWFSW